MVNFVTNASGAMLLIQVTESISGSVVPLAMFNILKWKGVCEKGAVSNWYEGGRQIVKLGQIFKIGQIKASARDT